MNQAVRIPTLDDVRAAQERIAPYLSPTPLYRYDDLTELVGTEIWVKHENHQPVGAFKVRGGINLALQLTAEERKRGLIAASTGNHGQSIAYAARLLDINATICVPGRVAAQHVCLEDRHYRRAQRCRGGKVAGARG